MIREGYITLDTARQCYSIVSKKLSIPVDVLLSERRDQEMVRARWMVMAEMRDCGASVNMIARRMQLDHSTVAYGLRCLDRKAAA